MGVVLLDADGVVERRWETLIDPQGSVGATQIHGVDAAMVAGAPLFTEVAGQLLDVLAGRVLVAHNAFLDVRFLAAEFRRADARLPRVPVVDTMHSASLLGLGGSSSLNCCAAAVGASRSSDVHGAGEDAFLCSQVLSAELCAARGGVGHLRRWGDPDGRALCSAGLFDHLPRDVRLLPRGVVGV